MQYETSESFALLLIGLTPIAKEIEILAAQLIRTQVSRRCYHSVVLFVLNLPFGLEPIIDLVPAHSPPIQIELVCTSGDPALD